MRKFGGKKLYIGSNLLPAFESRREGAKNNVGHGMRVWYLKL